MTSKTPPINKFNVRVYGLIHHEDGRLLVSDELIRGQEFTKFPGGGLEFGESTVDCIQRECLEEMNQKVEVLGHFYTTDEFVRSAFRPWEQVVSIYYRLKLVEPINLKVSSQKFDFDPKINGDQESFRWAEIPSLDPKDFAFLIDARVVELLQKDLG